MPGVPGQPVFGASIDLLACRCAFQQASGVPFVHGDNLMHQRIPSTDSEAGYRHCSRHRSRPSLQGLPAADGKCAINARWQRVQR